MTPKKWAYFLDYLTSDFISTRAMLAWLEMSRYLSLQAQIPPQMVPALPPPHPPRLRGVRAQWVLVITAGTQQSSQLLWSIKSGAVEVSEAILADRVTSLADHERYHDGAHVLLHRYRAIVQILFADAPAMLPLLLDGLIWRYRVTIARHRRVKYHMKDLLLNEGGKFCKCIDWMTKAQDLKFVYHPALTLLADLVWSRVACASFMYNKSCALFTLFTLSCS